MTETKSENNHPSITGDYLHVMTLVHNDAFKRLMERSLVVTLEKIKDDAGRDTID